MIVVRKKILYGKHKVGELQSTLKSILTENVKLEIIANFITTKML